MEFIACSTGSTTNIAEARCSNSDLGSRSFNCKVYLKPRRVVAERRDGKKPVKEVLKEYASSDPKKLRQLWLLYNVAHGKIGVLDEDEAHEKTKSQDGDKASNWLWPR